MVLGACHHDPRPLFAFEGKEPTISPTAWIAPTATLVGDVRVEDDASIWYGAVLRADFGPIIVRPGANIQDGSVIHGGMDPITEVGEGVTVGHLCVVHGAVLGAEALIGNGATVLDGRDREPGARRGWSHRGTRHARPRRHARRRHSGPRRTRGQRLG
jgi:acetyltransferase-like isoleucine patch superfamily enzyme